MNYQIKWNIINSLLAGVLVFAGAFADGNISLGGIIAALSASLIVAISKFRDYWQNVENKIACFVGF